MKKIESVVMSNVVMSNSNKVKVGFDESKITAEEIAKTITALGRYLNTVHATEITSIDSLPFRVHCRDVPSSAAPTPSTGESFWIASASGPGVQQIVADLRSGDWASPPP